VSQERPSLPGPGRYDDQDRIHNSHSVDFGPRPGVSSLAYEAMRECKAACPRVQSRPAFGHTLPVAPAFEFLVSLFGVAYISFWLNGPGVDPYFVAWGLWFCLASATLGGVVAIFWLRSAPFSNSPVGSLTSALRQG
jgi:hypothetical protein